jgi:hypothetical protein
MGATDDLIIRLTNAVLQHTQATNRVVALAERIDTIAVPEIRMSMGQLKEDLTALRERLHIALNDLDDIKRGLEAVRDMGREYTGKISLLAAKKSDSGKHDRVTGLAAVFARVPERVQLALVAGAVVVAVVALVFGVVKGLH